MDRILAAERTRERLKALMEGRSEADERRCELVRPAARLILEKALESEAKDALGRDYYARGPAPGAGYRHALHLPPLFSSSTGAVGYTTTTDPRSRRNRAESWRPAANTTSRLIVQDRPAL